MDVMSWSPVPAAFPDPRSNEVWCRNQMGRSMVEGSRPGMSTDPDCAFLQEKLLFGARVILGMLMGRCFGALIVWRYSIICSAESSQPARAHRHREGYTRHHTSVHRHRVLANSLMCLFDFTYNICAADPYRRLGRW